MARSITGTRRLKGLAALTLGLCVAGMVAGGVASADESEPRLAFSASDCAASNETDRFDSLDDSQVVDCIVEQTGLSAEVAEEIVNDCAGRGRVRCIEEKIEFVPGDDLVENPPAGELERIGEFDSSEECEAEGVELVDDEQIAAFECVEGDGDDGSWQLIGEDQEE